MKSLQVVIRTDASTEIGSGHVMRCVTLATALRERGCHVRFITREHPGHLAGFIESRGFECARLPAPEVRYAETGEPPGKSYAEWLGCSQIDDARETTDRLANDLEVDWLIVDHYALDAQWESRLRMRAARIMVIDDLADRGHDCDLLCDQNLYLNLDTRYAVHVPSGCDLLLGPRYALLSEGFARQRAFVESRRFAAPYRVLVFFGGVDATDETSRFLQAWRRVRRDDLIADIVTGIGNPRAAEIAAGAADLPGVRVHAHLSNMPQMMAHSDYAFGACGATNWERFCTGLNSTLTSVAENQLQLAQDLAAQGLVEYLGDWRQALVDTYEQALTNLDPTAESMKQRRSRIMAQVDGYGVQRVVQRLMDIGVG